MLFPVLTTRTVSTILGSLLFGTILFVRGASYGSTALHGAPILVPEFTSAGVTSTTQKFPLMLPIYAYATHTGSSTLKYPSVCAPNPFKTYSLSGIVVNLVYENINNPTAVGGDIGFVKSCGDAGGSGSSLLIDNTCTSSGCNSYFRSGTGASFNGADFIKFTPRSTLPAGFAARLVGILMGMKGG